MRGTDENKFLGFVIRHALTEDGRGSLAIDAFVLIPTKLKVVITDLTADCSVEFLLSPPATIHVVPRGTGVLGSRDEIYPDLGGHADVDTKTLRGWPETGLNPVDAERVALADHLSVVIGKEHVQIHGSVARGNLILGWVVTNTYAEFLRHYRHFITCPSIRPVMIGTAETTPSWVVAAEIVPISEDVELDTHRQEKGKPDWIAGFTCGMCIRPYRSYEGCDCDVFHGPKEHPWSRPPSSGFSACRRRSWENPAVGCGLPLKHTLRCRECNTKMKRWQKTRRYAERIANCNDVLEGSFVAFVTMTIPNVRGLQTGTQEVADAARMLKRRVANFRRGADFGKHVLGGIDVVELAGKSNIHHHGIWVMEKSWKQSEFQDTWKHGIVHIQKVRKPHAVLRYLTAYATKEPIEGVRCLETFGAARGVAYSAIEEYVARAKSSLDDADVAND